MKLMAKLEKSPDFWFLFASCVGFFLLRLPSLFEPYWYGDEGIYEVIGYALRHGRMLYSGIWDNKPPLLYITYSLFSGDQFAARLLSLIFGIGTLIVFYFLAKQVFLESKSARFATAFFAFFFSIPLLEGNIANAENFILFFIVLAGYFLYKSKLHRNQLFLIGFLLSVAFLYKIVAAFDTAAFGIFLLITHYKKVTNLIREIVSLAPLIVGFLLPILLTGLFFFSQGIFKEFYTGAFVQNVGYVGYGNKFIIPQGLLIVKVLLLVLATFLLFSIRNRLTKTELFIYLWSAFALFDVFFSQRPYTHYMLMLLPSFSLLFGLILWKKKKYNFAFISFISILILLVINFHFYGKPLSYYSNFLSYIANQESTEAYEKFFDTNVVRDVEIANYLKQYKKPNDNVFLWGNSAQVYRLSGTMPPGRYTVAYHITANKESLKETDMAVQTASPRFIVVFENAATYPYSLNSYKEVLTIANSQIYEKQ